MLGLGILDMGQTITLACKKGLLLGIFFEVLAKPCQLELVDIGLATYLEEKFELNWPINWKVVELAI